MIPLVALVTLFLAGKDLYLYYSSGRERRHVYDMAARLLLFVALAGGSFLHVDSELHGRPPAHTLGFIVVCVALSSLLFMLSEKGLAKLYTLVKGLVFIAFAVFMIAMSLGQSMDMSRKARTSRMTKELGLVSVSAIRDMDEKEREAALNKLRACLAGRDEQLILGVLYSLEYLGPYEAALLEDLKGLENHESRSIRQLAKIRLLEADLLRQRRERAAPAKD